MTSAWVARFTASKRQLSGSGPPTISSGNAAPPSARRPSRAKVTDSASLHKASSKHDAPSTLVDQLLPSSDKSRSSAVGTRGTFEQRRAVEGTHDHRSCSFPLPRPYPQSRTGATRYTAPYVPVYVPATAGPSDAIRTVGSNRLIGRLPRRSSEIVRPARIASLRTASLSQRDSFRSLASFTTHTGVGLDRPRTRDT